MNHDESIVSMGLMNEQKKLITGIRLGHHLVGLEGFIVEDSSIHIYPKKGWG